MNKPFVIIALDGGGMRGYSQALLLHELEMRLARLSGSALASFCKLIVGTSAGGINAAIMTHPSVFLDGVPQYDCADLPYFYRHYGPDIFRANPFRLLASKAGLVGYKYGKVALRNALADVLGETTMLSECMVPTMVTGWQPHVSPGLFLMGSHRAKQRGPSHDFRLVDAVEATASAPSYFEGCDLRAADGKTYHVVDGGLSCGNPAMVAIAESKLLDTNNAILISVGTGSYFQPARISGRAVALSAGDLIGETLRASAEGVDYFFDGFGGLPENYYRFDVPLPQRIAMDDASTRSLEVQLEATMRYIDTVSDRLDALVKRLSEIKPQAT